MQVLLNACVPSGTELTVVAGAGADVDAKQTGYSAADILAIGPVFMEG